MVPLTRPSPVRCLAATPAIVAALAAVALLLLPNATSFAAETAGDAPGQPVFFRSDLGLASPNTDPLPDRFDGPTSLRWRTPLDPGHSTPCVISNRIVVTTFRPASRELATVALDTATGRVVWRRPLIPPQVEETHAIGSPATATPASDGSRVFVFFGSHGLIAYDLHGNQLWEQRLGPFQDEYGAGSSPIVVDGRVILLQDHDRDSFLAAYDTASGRLLWRTARPDAVRSYSTPAVLYRDGRPELLVAGALELAGYDPADGRRLWVAGGLARIVIPTPVPVGAVVYMASWSPGGDVGQRLALDPWSVARSKWDRDGDGTLRRDEIDDAQVLDRYFRMDVDRNGTLDEAEWNRHAEVFRRARNSILAIRPPPSDAGETELAEDAVAWRHPRGAPYVATPVVYRGEVWMVKDGGLVTRLESATGRLLGEERLPGIGSYYASPVAGDGKVYFVSQAGVLSVVDAAPGWRVISSHEFREKVHATPVVRGGRFLLRSEAALYCY